MSGRDPRAVGRRPRALPRAAAWLLRHTLPAAQLDAVAGDLQEAASRRRGPGRGLRALLSALAIAAEFRLGGADLRAGGSDRDARLGRTALRARPAPIAAFVDGVRQAARSVRRAPALTAVVAITLGLGIGANATMFRVVDRLLLRPPDHVQDPERVRRIAVERADLRTGGRSRSTYLTYPDYDDLVGAASFDVAGLGGAPAVLGRGRDARPVATGWATASLFPLLGVSAPHGRFYSAEEDRIGAEPVAVLGHALWRSHYGGDPDVLGSSLEIRGRAFTIIGVAPPGFTGIDLSVVDVWLPLHVAGTLFEGDDWEDNRSWYWFRAVARVADGVPLATAEAEATTLHLAGRAEYIAQERWDPQARILMGNLIAARGSGASTASRVATWLTGVSAIVLLIACANVANLLLARGLVRRRELAVRGALGVSRSRLAWQLLAETLIMTTLGGVLALLIANAGGDLLRRTLLPDVDFTRSAISFRVFAFTALATLATGVIAGLIPAIRAGTTDPAAGLRSGGNRLGTARSSLMENGLLVTQGVLTVVLLAGAGLFVRSLDQVRRLDLGIVPDDLGFVQLQLEARSWGLEERLQLHQRALQETEAIPGVAAAAVTSTVPFSGSWSVNLSVPGVELQKPASGGPYVYAVTADYLHTLGTRVVRGRDFDADDRRDAQPVALVNEAMARGIWGTDEPIGQCLSVGGDEGLCFEVVGIVADTRRQELVESEQWLYYVPIDQAPLAVDMLAPQAVMLRAARLDGTLAVVRDRLLEIPGVDYVRTGRFRELLDPQTRAWRLGATLFTLFGGLAVLMAGIGLSSVLGFSVTRRRRELGIRSALGALPRQIVGLVLRQAVGVALVSGALGLLITLAATPALEELLFQVSPRDPAVLGSVAVLLLLGAIGAAIRPALRAARVDPDTALRAE